MITEYDPSYAARAHDLCMVGLTEVEIAKVLGLSVGMLRAWRDRYPDFDYAWTSGVAMASVKVVAALVKRACGYDKMIWKETKDGTFQELKHIEPSVPACVFYLTNKHPEQWKSKVEHEVGGGATIPLDVMAEIEAARRVAFVLAKAMHESRSIEHGNADVQGETE